MVRKQVDHVNHSLPGGDILESVHAVMHALRSRLHRVARDGPDGLSPMDARVLVFYARHPGATQSELSAHAGRDKGQVARLVASLRAQGLLEAQPDPVDRRSVRLQLTPEGRAAQQALQRQRRRLADQACAGLDEEERAVLQGLLRRVLHNLERLP